MPTGQAGCMRMVNGRHPEVAETMLDGMVRGPVECFGVVRSCAQTLIDAGFEMPHVETSRGGCGSGAGGQSRAKWAKVWVATKGLLGAPQEILPGFICHVSQSLKVQCGPFVSSALTAVRTHRMTKIDPQLFRVVLRRRLGLSLPLSSRTCRCGRQLDSLGHHRAACSEAGVLGRRGFPLECAAAQVCREAATAPRGRADSSPPTEGTDPPRARGRGRESASRDARR